MLPSWAYRLVLFASVLVHFCLAYWVDRSNSFLVIGSFITLWAVFLIQWVDQKIGTKQIIAFGMLFRLVYLVAVPELSDDVFRYIWDGMLLTDGVSPYEMLPSEWLQSNTNISFSELFPLLNSPDYYSIYPPGLQFFFGLSTWFGGGDVHASIVALRVFVLLAEFGSMFLIWKLLQAWRMNVRNVMLYAFSPLVIIEFSGSLHGEVFAVFFLLLSLWLLVCSTSPNPSKESLIGKKQKQEKTPSAFGHSPFSGGELSSDQTLNQRVSSPPEKGEYRKAGRGYCFPFSSVALFLSAIAFGASVGVKLLPLMFLPFFIKRLGWMKAALYGLVVAVTVGLMYAPFWSPELIQNTRDTLNLYFASFEFNASIYYLIRAVGFWVKGYNIIGMTAVWLPRVVLLSILLLALLNKDKQVSGLPKMMLFAWFIYYALATTVNPWYVAVLAAFLPFVKYRFALVWMMLIPLSYHAFGYADYHENLWVITIEYVPVYLWLLFEVGALKSLEKWWALRRAEVKRKRLLPFLSKGEKLLEVGSGNGALSVFLQNEGMEVDSLDVENKSIFNEVDVMVYDGEKFPYVDQQFDTCQLITMLHHTTNAEGLIREAKRVSSCIIIMEDIYESHFQKYLTWFTDSLVNWEFFGHPHTNKTDAEWRIMFEENGLVLKEVEYYRFLLFFKQVTYVLKPKG